MNGGLFITLYDEETLSLYLRNGLYGSLMTPYLNSEPSSRSPHYAILADYACSRTSTHVFFFLKRKVIYGGLVEGNVDIASFYLNGPSSPLGRVAEAGVFWDESDRYASTENPGVFVRDGKLRSQPFIIRFSTTRDTGKVIASDDLYFALGKYPYPLPSNTIQGMSFCTLTPGEVEIALDLIRCSNDIVDLSTDEPKTLLTTPTLFQSALLSYGAYTNEAHLEFTLLADLTVLKNVIPDKRYILCRQVPISPFKPVQMDRADICLYDIENPIRSGTVPNIIIELKRTRANIGAYMQVVKYLKWLEKVLDDADEFNGITAYLIAPSFYFRPGIFDLPYRGQIKMYNYESEEFHTLGE